MRIFRIALLLVINAVAGILLIHPIPIFSPTILEAGEIYGNDAMTREFHVFNLGLRSLEIDKYRGSCVCSSVDGPMSLPPFSWSTLAVHIKSRGVSGGYHVELAVEFHGESPKLLSIYGTRIITCRADPVVVSLSALDEVSPGRMQTEMEFIFSEPIPAASISFATKTKKLKVTPLTQMTGNVSAVRLRLDYDSPDTKGTFLDWIRVGYLMHQPADYTVQVQGKLAGGLELDPPQVELSALNPSAGSQVRLAVAGLQAGEKLDDVQFSGGRANRKIAWTVDDKGNLDLAFSKLDDVVALAPFSMLARTNKGQTAAVYFSR